VAALEGLAVAAEISVWPTLGLDEDLWTGSGAKSCEHHAKWEAEVKECGWRSACGWESAAAEEGRLGGKWIWDEGKD
jgi:hypothetical protein